MTYYYPAEWEKQKCIWLTFPHNENEWGKERLPKIREFYIRLISIILDFQDVNLILNNETLISDFPEVENKKYKLKKLIIPNNDIWIRDYGPFFMSQKPRANSQQLIAEFEFNSWGEKFPPWDLDNNVPKEIAGYYGSSIESYPMILEGGAVEFNGSGLLLTTEQCLLSKNRNPNLEKKTIETILKTAFTVEEIIWLKRGLEGDHTDGHIDDFARFVGERKVLVCKAEKEDANYEHLNESIEYLKNWKHPKENYSLEIVEIPLPDPMFLNGERLPNSYANFIFVNGGVIVPTFNCSKDSEALEIFKKLFPDREIRGIDCTLLIQEGGGLHCMTKQE